MSENSENEDYSDGTISDEDESDEDNFVKIVSEDLHQCAFLTGDSIGDPSLSWTTQILLEYQLGRWVPRLREPRDLYGVSSSGPLSPTRWPYHCEVIDEKIQHIDCLVRRLRQECIEYILARLPRKRTTLIQLIIGRLMEKREVILYCDFHGHSKKENIFMYGCGGSDRCKALYLQQQIFPLMLSKNCPDKFSFSACKFSVGKSKEGTGRVVIWKMGIRNSFTMEATFCGSTLGNKRGTHFNTKDLESMGYHFCDTLLDYCDPDRTKYYQCLKELEEMQKHVNLEKVLDDSDASLKGLTLDPESSSRGSDDSSESSDSQTYFLKLTSQIETKKKHLKTKKERNSPVVSLRNARQEQEVCDKGHLAQRHKASNSEVKDTRPNVSDDYVLDYDGRQLPNQSLEKIPGRAPPWLLKRCLSSQSVIQKLGKDKPRHFLEADKRPIQGIIQPTSTDLYGNCFKVTPLKYSMSKQTPNCTEKTRIPTEDLHHNLTSKMKECTSFQSKKTGVNWTDDEKRIYRNKRIAQTEEILQYMLPIVESTKNMTTGQMKLIFNPRTNCQIQPQLHPAPYKNMKAYRTSWASLRPPLLISQRNLMVSSSERCKLVSQKSFESLSLPKGHKKRKNCSRIKAIKTKDMKPVSSSKWETTSSCFEKDKNIIKGKSLLAKEPNQQSSKQTAFPSN